MQRIQNYLLALTLFFSLLNTLSAQLNTRIGYSYSFSQLSETNNILDRFDDQRPWLEEKFNHLRGMNGLILGLQYRLGSTALDISYFNRFKSVKAEGTDPQTNTSFFHRLNMSQQGLSLGLEQFIGSFSIAATIDRNLYRVKLKEESEGDNLRILNEMGWSSHFFIGIKTKKNSGIAVSLRPFLQIQWTDFNLGKIEEALELSPVEDKEERPMSIGIQLIFSNGN